jgi:hypothetical protein
MIRWMFTAAALAASGLALAKLPAPQLDEAAQAKAAEAKAKAAWQGKVDAYQLCKVQDRIAARYKTNHPAAAQPAPATQAAKPATTPASSTQGAATPVADIGTAPKIPACTDPGPFAYTPATQKPLETSGAHSPPGTATSPPSVKAESAKMTPAKPSTATKP